MRRGSLLVPVLGAVTMLLSLACAVAYLVAFAPPSLLRQAWREPGLRSFLAEAMSISPFLMVMTAPEA